MLNHNNKPSPIYLEVRCKGCEHIQLVFFKASTVVKCLECSTELSEPKGGKCKLINCTLYNEHYG